MSGSVLGRIAHRLALPEAVIETALEWQVLLWSQEATDEQRAALARWRAADPAHERAWRHVTQFDERLAAVPDAVAAGSLRAADRAVKRRKLLLAFAIVAAGGLSGEALRRSALVQARLADLRTATGEIRSVRLADGTRLSLNTASAVNVELAEDARRLRLVRGEVFIATAPDPGVGGRAARPFVVETGHGRVRPIGTRFTVRRRGTQSEVAVLAGAVRITPRRAAAEAVRLGAGEAARFTAGAVRPLAREAKPAAWVDGVLAVEQMPLGALLAELARYRRGVLDWEPAVAGLPVSGTFPVTDTDRALEALAQALPIRVSRRSPFWVLVKAR